MNNKIYKVSPTITKEEILQNCQYDSIYAHDGYVMSYEDFMCCVNSYCITDYYGSGNLILFDKIVNNTSIWITYKTVYFLNKFFIPFDVLHSIFGDNMKFIWFNK